MSQDQEIKKALSEIALAEEHSSQATKFYYSARKRLESIHAPASKKTNQKVSSFLMKRNLRIQKAKQ